MPRTHFFMRIGSLIATVTSRRGWRLGVGAPAAGLLVLLQLSAASPAQDPAYDLILRGGTIVDGTGAPRFAGDVAVRGGHIVRVGNLAGARASTVLEVRGLMVAPGFVNLHSHAVRDALPTAVNMLTQGVTTELMNADGSGPLDIGAQLDTLAAGGLAVNVAVSVGFNSVWTSVVGRSDRRPSADEVARMSALVVENLERGAFGVSAGLDYKPAYFATTDEVTRILAPAARWRTFFPNHDRVTPESGFSSRAGMEETMAIGQEAGLVPVFTHMKAQGREQGSAAAVVEMMERSTREGRWVAGDVYPYLAGQTALAALLIPGWAQDGGIDAMRARFADDTLRPRIVAEADAAIRGRLNGPETILLNETGRRLSDIMVQQGAASAGEAVVRVLETEFPSAIMSFGAEEDLVAFLQAPSVAVACDCGATTAQRGHPRAFGSFPRVLGHYVRETRALTWEEAIRKMTGLPASMAGMVDRGLIAPGMAADLTVFDTATVIDRATYESPTAMSEGIRHVVVNGVLALRDGEPTGAKAGRALRRASHMPSRPLGAPVARTLAARGAFESADAGGGARLVVDLTQASAARTARGSVRVEGGGAAGLRAVSLGTVQVAARWASVTGMARLGAGATERAFVLVVEEADPFVEGAPPTATLHVEGERPRRARLASVTVRPAARAPQGVPAK